MPLKTLLAAVGSGALVTGGFWFLAMVLGHGRQTSAWRRRRLMGGAQ